MALAFGIGTGQKGLISFRDTPCSFPATHLYKHSKEVEQKERRDDGNVEGRRKRLEGRGEKGTVV